MTDSFVQGPPSVPDINGDNWDVVERREALEYDPGSDTYRGSFDAETESVTMAVISTVAVVPGTDLTELPPLNSACDPDALETAVQPAIRGPENSDIHITFTFAGHTVTVHNYGIIAVQPPQEDDGESVESQDTIQQ